MQNNDERPTNDTLRLRTERGFTDDNNSLAVALQNLTTTLCQLTEASQAQTSALADLNEDLLLQDDADEPKPDRTAESLNIAQLTAIVNDCKCYSGAKNMAYDNRSDSKSLGQKTITERLTLGYLPNTKKSPTIEGKIAELIDNMLTGGMSSDTVKVSADKYSSPENIFLTSKVLIKRCGTCSHAAAVQ